MTGNFYFLEGSKMGRALVLPVQGHPLNFEKKGTLGRFIISKTKNVEDMADDRVNPESLTAKQLRGMYLDLSHRWSRKPTVGVVPRCSPDAVLDEARKVAPGSVGHYQF